MTPEEYTGADPYGKSTKMAKIVVSETSYLPLATINRTGAYILSMWMVSNTNQTVTLHYGSGSMELNLTTSWQRFEPQFRSYVDDLVYLELSVGTYYIWHSKLEIGNKATDWTVAPEDVDASVDSKLEKYATLEITDDRISTVVSSTRTYTDNAVNGIEVGGRNLFKGTRNFDSKYWGNITVSDWEKYDDFKQATVTSNNALSAPDTVSTPTANQGFDFSDTSKTFTISCWVKGTQDGQSIGVTLDANRIGYEPQSVPKGVWTKLVWTFKGSLTIQIFRLQGGTNISSDYPIYVAQMKCEYGNKATDWTPAPEDVESSAVATAKSYVDQTAESITATVEGVDGRLTKIEQDAYGFTWTIDETAIVTSVNEYYESTSPTSLSGGSWSTSQPTWTNGTYIWLRTKNTNGKGTSSYTTPVCITGNTGTDGKGIETAVVTYQAGSSGTTAPTGAWSTTVPLTTATAPYMWTKTVITYTDGTTSTSYSVGSTPEGITVGGRNLLIRSQSVEHSYYDMAGALNTNAPAGTAAMTSYIPITPNAAYTFSRKAGTGDYFRFNWYDADKNYISRKVITEIGDGTAGSYTWTSPNNAYYLLVSYPSDDSSEAKLEKGNKATDWTPAPEDVDSAIDGVSNAVTEAAKVATNYMKFANNGLTIGNMTNSTLGRNVLIDLDSVDIRNGSNVLASYGENIVLRHDGEDVFTIKTSEFLQTINNAGRMFTGDLESYSVGTVGYLQNTAISLTANTYYALRMRYSDGHDDEYFIFESTDSLSIYGWQWSSDNRITIKLLLNSSGTSSTTVPCAYCDSSAVSEMTIKGNLVIYNDSDTNGLVKSLPPLTVGIPSSIHMEIDGNEIAAKTNENTPNHLYFNMDGGNVSVNNNCERALLVQDGAIFAKNRSTTVPSDLVDKWVGIIDPVNADGNTTFGYGNYLYYGGGTHIYGNDIKLTSRNSIALEPAIATTSNKDITFSNGAGINGTNSSGVVRGNFDPCNANNNCSLGYGSFYAKEGATNIYGDALLLRSNNDIRLLPGSEKINCELASIYMYNGKGIYGTNASGAYRHNFQPCNTSNNCLVGYGSYSAKEGTTYIYGNDLALRSNSNITTNCDIVLPNMGRIRGTNTSGTTINNFQPCNENNNCVLGYGSYSASEGSTNIYGNSIGIYTKNCLTSNRTLKVLWSGSYYLDDSQIITLSEAVSKQLSGIVLAWSAYGSGAALNYYWNYIFIPKEHVLRHPGNGVSMLLPGGAIGYKYVYINDTTITGHANNSRSSLTLSGITTIPTNYVLRYVYGV